MTTGRSRQRRVVLVEDSVDAREALAALLELEGHDVRTAGDGAAGVALILAERPDLAFVDIGLPGLDGYEVAREVRRQGSRTVLVALTGYGQAEDLRRTQEAGFSSHLVKPVGASELLSAIAGLSTSD